MKASLKIFFNSIALYLKLFITVIVGLYLTRVVLNRLGVDDYGIYNLIGGVISLLSFLQAALTVSTQRYLSVAIGKKDSQVLNTVFSSSLAIHIVLSLGILAIFELCSLFLFDGFLNIPADRIWAAKRVYHIMVLSTFFTILQVPFTADITAREDLWLLAIVESVSAILKLCVIFLFDCSSLDALILYTLWVFIVTIVSLVPKLIWAVYRYDECRLFHFWKFIRKDSIKEMLGFTCWNAFGTLALLGRNQGVAILQNIFFGPSINAVYGIANQLNGHLVYCSNAMTTSITPQIMKSEGEGNRSRMLRLSVFASKLAFFLSAVFALPLIIEIDTVLLFWLKTVPEYTSTYCILILCMFLIMQLYPGLSRAVQAIGDIRTYQIVTSILLLLPLPIGYIMYKLGMHNTSVLYVMILSQIIQMIYAIWYLHRRTGLDMMDFYMFILKAIVIFMIIYVIGNQMHLFLISHTSIVLTFLFTCSTVVLLYAVSTYMIVFNKFERESIYNMIKSLIKKR